MKNIFKFLLIGMIGLLILGCGEDEPSARTSVSNNGEGTSVSNNGEGTSVSNNGEGTSVGNSGEGTEPVENSTTVVSKTYYGNWVYIADGTEVKIDKDFPYPIKYLGANFIEITKEDNSNHLLLRDGSINGVVRGRLYTDIEHVQKLDIEREEKITHYLPIFNKFTTNQKYTVIIDDGFNRQSKIVSSNGEFSFSGVMTMKNSRITIIQGATDIGDIEEVIEDDDDNTTETTINDNSEPTVEPITEETQQESDEIIFDQFIPINNEDTDLGNFSIPDPDKEDKYNFKTTQVIDTQDKDDRYMYENRTFSLRLFFTNTGEELATGLNYEITTSDPYVEELTHDVVMGSVEVNQTIEIPIEVTFGRLDKIAHRVKLDFLIRDVHRNEWLDHVYLDVYQTPVTVNLKTKTSNLKGYFITPEHEIINIDTKDIKVKIPSRPDSSYYFLVASPKDIGAETAYSIGVDVNTSDFDDFHDTSAYEPNNLEEKASKLKIGDSIKSFIHKGDIDFYTIDFQETLSFEPPRLPFN